MFFLATLGVYLGLLVAGASPVLGHAATARNFDLRDEIEFADDLDKKPDDERSPVTASLQIYLEDIDYFLSSLARLHKQGRFDLRKDTFEVVQSSFLPCIDSNKAGSYTPVRFQSTSQFTRPALEYFSRGMVYGYSLGDCVPSFAFDGIAVAESKYDFHLDDKAFTINVAVKKNSPQNALKLLAELDSTLRLFSGTQNPKRFQKIIDGTRFRAEIDQVFVLTCLPRGSLETLLAADAK